MSLKFLMLGVILQLCRNLVYFYSFSSVCLLLTMRSNRIKPVSEKVTPITRRAFAEISFVELQHTKLDGFTNS